MPQLFRLPALGQTMEEGTLVRWLKSVGDPVQQGEPLVEVMTDKATMEVEAPASGTLLMILAAEDATVPVQGALAVIGQPGEDPMSVLDSPPADGGAGSVDNAASSTPGTEDPKLETPPSKRPPSSPRARRKAAQHGVEMGDVAGTGPNDLIQERDVWAMLSMGSPESDPVRITPLAQRMAEDAGIEPRELVGSGPGGKIRSEDVKKATEPETGAPLPIDPIVPPVRPTERIPLSRMRRLVASALTHAAQSIPSVTITREVDATELARLRERILPDIEKRFRLRVSLTDFLVKACALALPEHPWLNSSLDGDAVVLHGEMNLGIAVAIPDGLIVPVIRNADVKTIPAISAEVKDLAARARTGKLLPDELSGGTFTLSNLGGAGVDIFTPIINPPQCAILGVGRMVERPAFGSGGAIEARRFIALSLTFDHRIVDGVPAAQFLSALAELIENPYRLLL